MLWILLTLIASRGYNTVCSVTENVSEAVFAFHPRKRCALSVLPVTWPHQIEQKSSTVAKTQPRPNTLRNEGTKWWHQNDANDTWLIHDISRERIPAIFIFFLFRFENIFCLWARTGCEPGARISIPSLLRLLHTIRFSFFFLCVVYTTATVAVAIVGQIECGMKRLAQKRSRNNN